MNSTLRPSASGSKNLNGSRCLTSLEWGSDSVVQ